MQTALLTARGAVPYLKQELSQLNCAMTVEGSDYLLVDLSSEQQQWVHQHSLLTTRLLSEAVILANEDELTAHAPTLVPVGSFAVKATGPERFRLPELIGGLIHDHTQAKVNLSKPDTAYLIHDTDGQFIIGVDRFGDLGKRSYKIITGASSLAGPIAATTIRASGWNGEQDIVVWPCGTGELAIEAAFLATNKSPRAYELKLHEGTESKAAILAADPKLALVSAAQKNAKIAGVHASIRFSRQDLDWLDVKHDEKGIGFMVGLLPNLAVHPKFVGELFYQLDYLLAKGGQASFVCVNDATVEILEAAAIKAERVYEPSRVTLWSGQHALTLVTLISQKQKKRKQ